MRTIFITGTDTGVGKTVICGLLSRFVSEKGCRVIIQKWIQTGRERLPKDYPLQTAVYNFKYPCSPHLAASLERKTINAAKIKEGFRFLLNNFDFVIVEGTGGALVPFNRRRLIIDIAKELNLPVLIVSSNRLGAINHTLLTIEAVKKRKMKIIGIIFNNQKKAADALVLNDNPKIIKELSGERILGVLPYCKDKNKLYGAFLPIGNKVVSCKD